MIRISTTFLALLIAALSVTAGAALATDAAKPAAGTWGQPAGPNGNWKINGSAPTEWSVVRNENIRWYFLKMILQTSWTLKESCKAKF